ncbi:hypothetical protein [Longimicrobium terrae]|uniref:Uncharacterized protein n=1 Tax=Longimicrobium terrae TaxID=1639882 RepID=A0A841GWA5_9BACT|nr:hypothetical protein [Longimicrobium terrae]MBB4635640.1 hypothetical protein [Longimicrobium terrae]MBB6070034.1 hypothetical protein [Longimicrobium terrae]NNC32940.1 hypothetical protein [Longimicrobium terrae]
MRRFLSHADAFDADPRVDEFRAKLGKYLAGELSPGTWGFVLYSRPHPRDFSLPARVLAFATATDSAPLTPALIAKLPDRLWLEGDPGVVNLAAICDAPELHDEPVPAALLRIRPDRVDEMVTFRISAGDVASGGLIFVAATDGPPPGWPR